MLESEIKSIQSLFQEELELEVYDVSSYGTYRIASYNGIEPPHKILVYYYYDESYLSFSSRTPGYQGALTVVDKGPANSGGYAVYAAGKYKFFDTREHAESRNGFVLGEDRISLLDILAWGYMCTFPNGNSVSYPVNDESESYAEAEAALGWTA